MKDLFARLQQYVDGLGGVEAIAAMPADKLRQAFIPFIKNGNAKGNKCQAFLGCTMQAYVNWSSQHKEKINAEHLNRMIGGYSLISRSDATTCTFFDAHSYDLLFRALLNPQWNPAIQCSEEEGLKLSGAVAGFLSEWSKRRSDKTEQLIKEWGDLITQYDASPFKDKSIAIVGNEESIDFDYLKQSDERQFLALGPDCQTPPSFLFKNVREFRDYKGYLDIASARQHAGEFDAVLDCNAANSKSSENANEVMQLMAKITKRNGLIVHDITYGGRGNMANEDSRHELGERILERNLHYVILQQEHIPRCFPFEAASGNHQPPGRQGWSL